MLLTFTLIIVVFNNGLFIIILFIGLFDYRILYGRYAANIYTYYF